MYQARELQVVTPCMHSLPVVEGVMLFEAPATFVGSEPVAATLVLQDTQQFLEPEAPSSERIPSDRWFTRLYPCKTL